MGDSGIPTRLAVNAWTGGKVGVSGAAGDPVQWALDSDIPAVDRMLFADPPPDLWDWKNDRVGWGLILPENESISFAERARAADAPNPIRQLLDDRSDAPVFRYRPDSPNRMTTLMRYFTGASAPLAPSIAASAFGVGYEQIPYYLLICASPADIPWEFQYLLNTRFAVGRLDLDERGLANYVAALRAGWATAGADPFTAVVWATDHGGGDMSAVMRGYVADPVFQALSGDSSLRARSVLIDRAHGGATSETLRRALVDRVPGLIVTTSHGVTCPLEDPVELAANLGLLVGEDYQYSAPAEILASWQPDGAIWYSHACCSAGASSETVYGGINGLDPEITRVLTSVAAVGSMVAPLPRALLGADRPARAFIGHVEPTFDYTIRQPQTSQALTAGLTQALHDSLYQQHKPGRVGHAFRAYFDPIATAAGTQITLRRDYDLGKDVARQLLTSHLTARDRMSTVILGDPTVQFTWPGPIHAGP